MLYHIYSCTTSLDARPTIAGRNLDYRNSDETMTPSRRRMLVGAKRATVPTTMGSFPRRHIAVRSTALSRTPGRGLAFCLVLLLGAARGFLLQPVSPDMCRCDHRLCTIGTARIASNTIAARPRLTSRRAASEDRDDPLKEDGGDRAEDWPLGGTESDGENARKGDRGQELTAEEKAKREANIDWDDDDALWKAFPNPPKPPTAVLPDARDLTLAQLSEGEFEVSYGGQSPARRAIEEFEREERSRIHLATARRVLRYNLVQQQAKEMRELLELEETEAQGLLMDDEMGEDDRDPKWNKVFPWEGMVEAEYEWEKMPELVTFSGFGVLYNWVIPLGNILRDALARAHGYAHRLPGPQRFAFHFENSFKESDYHMPCFGKALNLTSWDWWFHVFTDTYIKTMLDYDLPEELITEKMDDITDELYYEIMVGPEAYELVPHVKVVLETLAAWRANGGPKLAVVANADERLNVTLENMGILPYFDFVLTTHEVDDGNLYDKALEIAGVEDPSKAIHFGSNYDLDVEGPCKAGWDACLIKPRQSDYEQPGEIYKYHRLMRIGEVLHRYDLPGADMPVLFRRRGNFWEEPDESVENNPDLLGA